MVRGENTGPTNGTRSEKVWAPLTYRVIAEFESQCLNFGNRNCQITHVFHRSTRSACGGRVKNLKNIRKSALAVYYQGKRFHRKSSVGTDGSMIKLGKVAD